MKQRIITGACLTIVVGLFVYFSKIPYVLNTFVLILSVFGTYEIYKATKTDNKKVWLFSSFIADILISFLKTPYYDIVTSVLFAALILLFIPLMTHFEEISSDKITPWKVFVFTVALPLSFKTFVEIRSVKNGIYYVILVLITTAFTDIFAQLTGMAFGKHKMCRKLSPNKTVEGSVGGILTTLVLILVLTTLFSKYKNIQVNFGLLCLYCVLVSVIGQFGDLSMSVIKRICGIKDYGKLLPGHGGILDRFDSMLFTAPFTLIFYNIFESSGGLFPMVL